MDSTKSRRLRPDKMKSMTQKIRRRLMQESHRETASAPDQWVLQSEGKQAEGTNRKLVTSLIEELQRHSDGRLVTGITPSPPARGWSSWFALLSGTTWTDSEGCYGLRNSPLAQGETCPGLRERFRWTMSKQFRNHQENWKCDDTSLLLMASNCVCNFDRSESVKLILSVPLTGRDWLSYGR